MTRLARRITTAQLILASATFYAAIPVIITLGSADLKYALPTLLVAMKTLVSLPVLLWADVRRALAATLRSARRTGFQMLNAGGFIGSLYFFAMAIEGGAPTMAIVVLETWPVLTALVIAPIAAHSIEKLSRGELFWGLVAIIGVAFVLAPPEQLLDQLGAQKTSIGHALLSAGLMALSVAAKAVCVRDLKAIERIGPLRSYFILQIMFLPVLVVYVAGVLVFEGLDGLRPTLGVTRDNMLIVAGIFLANILSSMLFSVATLKMKRASETFIWFFAPAIAFLLFVLTGPRALTDHELIGLTFIVSANLLSAIRADVGLPFRALVASLLTIGAFCHFVPGGGAGMGATYFDALSVLSIFFVIILSFTMEWVARRREEFERHMVALVNALGHLPPADRRLAGEMLCRLEAARHPILFRRIYDRLARLLGRLGADRAAAALNELANAQNHRLPVGYFVSLGAILLASLVIGLLSRDGGWVADVFATIYLPSMIFAFALLIERSQFARQPMVRLPVAGDAALRIRVHARRPTRDAVFWTLFLSLFVLAVLFWVLLH